ncbi:hypothetical protein [Chitinophaga deserti]|uniref:hypothetical protein n=1 Tax=Chitinophaga deserti TaxID=2164099 RepID=UPI001300A8AB|nr:hypothetical protein [Chitinophaga deserti]
MKLSPYNCYDRQPYDPLFTDEASVAERYSTEVNLVEGEERNKLIIPSILSLREFS